MFELEYEVDMLTQLMALEAKEDLTRHNEVYREVRTSPTSTPTNPV